MNRKYHCCRSEDLKQEVHLHAHFTNSLFLLMKYSGGYQLRGDLIIRYPLFFPLQQDVVLRVYLLGVGKGDRKSTRLNSSHVSISYAAFCLKIKRKSTHDYSSG